MQFPVFIELRRSLIHQVLLAAMHAAAALCVLALPVGWVLRGLLLVPVLVSGGLTLRSPSIVALQLSEAELHIRTSAGAQLLATLRPACAVFTCLAVLRLRCEGEAKGRSLVIFPDSLSRDDFRKLRVWLRWKTSPFAKGVAPVS